MTYSINTEKILFNELGDEGVIYELETNKYLLVNQTCFRILKAIDSGQTTETIVNMLCNEYIISEDACRIEVTNALSELTEKKYIYK